MKEAFLAALLSIGPNADNEVRLMELVTPVKNDAGKVINVRKYVPAISSADNKTGDVAHIVRHITDQHS